MGKKSNLIVKTGAALVAALLTFAFALPAQAANAGKQVLVAEADCYAIGQQVADDNGGTLARAQADTRGGQQVCVIVVLVPGKEGQRPRRTEIVVPAN